MSSDSIKELTRNSCLFLFALAVLSTSFATMGASFAAPSSSGSEKACPPNTTLNNKGQCVAQPTVTVGECPSGYIDAGSQCYPVVEKKVLCPELQPLDPDTGLCSGFGETFPPFLQCPPNSVDAGVDNLCIDFTRSPIDKPVGGTTCPEGTTLNKEGTQCVGRPGRG
jgi:hypothetical protein